MEAEFKERVLQLTIDKLKVKGGFTDLEIGELLRESIKEVRGGN